MKIALLGMGTVGSGVYELLEGREDMRIVRILDRRSLGAADRLRTENIEEILSDEDIDTVVELLGGVEPARSWAEAALRAGKHLVSANKLMLSAGLPGLLRAAREGGAQMRISASVGGGIPYLPNLIRARRVDELREIGGIVNGTTNLILDTMQREDADFAEVLARAQREGYAEADPSADIDGIDARSKLAIAASTAFGALVPPEAIPTEGIRRLTKGDVANFKRMGRVCRLLARAERREEGVAACVEPTLVRRESLEASIHGCDNCIVFAGDRCGRQALIGPGAGKLPTAYAVVEDLTDLLSGAAAPDYVPGERAATLCPGSARRYYVRAAAALPFPAEPAGERAFLTGPVSPEEMAASMARLRREDPSAFCAALAD